MKHIFHTLESIGSARIEGNNTTIAEYIETKLDEHRSIPPSIREIQNIEKAMDFIDEHIKEFPINRAFLSEMHKMVVDGLAAPPAGEGDALPGEYRKHAVKINKSTHIPPDAFLIAEYMEELMEFINRSDSPKYDLLKVAIAHHRFVWIHPFGNGNGRTVRLFTYAMLIKSGFNVDIGRILNPTAVFCSNRNDYYKHLSEADSGTSEGILNWCTYVLKGLKEEIEKIDRLLNYDFLRRHILVPAIDYSLERRHITELEAKLLRRVAEKQLIQAANVKDLLPRKASAEVSRQLRKLIEKKMLMPEKAGTRKYVIRFDNSYLLRGVIQALGERSFLPTNE
ncbi:Fic family protein [Compostibacter hankyongensis]|uniref:Fic family protein n=1 Tax=Compostibacter hankyongensis TaxID=1007089 RepID=A0ABP8G7S7_9BACT